MGTCMIRTVTISTTVTISYGSKVRFESFIVTRQLLPIYLDSKILNDPKSFIN